MKALILLLLLSGCATWTQMECTDSVSVAQIKWVQTQDPYAECEKRGAKTLNRDGACIVVETVGEYSTATLYALPPSQIDEGILGHEIKHTFGCKHS